MIMNKDFVMEMITYMKDNRDMTVAEKCKALGISIPGYYKACRRHGLDGKIRQSRSQVDMDKARKVMAYAREIKDRVDLCPCPVSQRKQTQPKSGILKCTQAQDSLE